MYKHVSLSLIQIESIDSNLLKDCPMFLFLLKFKYLMNLDRSYQINIWEFTIMINKFLHKSEKHN